MRKELQEYLDKRRKSSEEHSANLECFVRDIEAFIKLIEEHKHYKKITNRVLKRFTGEDGNVSVKFSSYPIQKISFVGGKGQRYFENYISYGRYNCGLKVFEPDYSPENIIEACRHELDRCKPYVVPNIYEDECKFLIKLDLLLEEHPSGEDVVFYGFRNR